MWKHGLPIWLHPVRTSANADYAAEQLSRFEAWTIMGWPYATSVAMLRLVITGLFDRYPGIKIITHHLGGNIPYHEGRVDNAFANMGRRTVDEDYLSLKNALRRPPIDYFRMFYGDTAMFGGVIGARCGLEYFGADHVVFASDAPVGGPTTAAFQVIDELELSEADREKICHGNAERLMKVSFD
jgi:aminocarboxymuconate-semialdehyde decarboxylase